MLTINYMRQRDDFHNGPNDSEICTYILAFLKNTIKYKENCFLKPTGALNSYNSLLNLEG